MALHRDLTGSELHEMKGADAALLDTVPHGTGSGSTVFKKVTGATVDIASGSNGLPSDDLQNVLQNVYDTLVTKPTVVTTPTTATDSGTAGEIAFDSNYIYVCIAADTWKRAALSTW